LALIAHHLSLKISEVLLEALNLLRQMALLLFLSPGVLNPIKMSLFNQHTAPPVLHQMCAEIQDSPCETWV